MRNFAKPLVFAAVFGPKVLVIGSKLAKSVKAVKFGLAGASVAAYSWMFTWEFSIILIVSLVIHEYGHVWAMRTIGIPTRGFYLIPFVGGAAVQDRAFKSRLEEHFVSLAGPAFGLGQATLLYALFVYTEHPLLGAVTAWVAVLNLLNMVPITPLDGGRMVKCATLSIGSRFGMALLLTGIIVCVVLMFWLKVWLLGLIALFSVFEFMFERRTHRFTPEPFLKRMPAAQTVWCLLSYALVTVALGVVVYGCLSVPEARLALMILSDG